MRIDDWLMMVTDDATRRGMPELVPLLQALARSTATLREADRTARANDTNAAAATGHVTPPGAR